MVYTWQLTWRTDRHLLCLVAIQLQSAQVLQVSFTFRVSILPTLYVCTILCPTFSVAVNLIKLHKYCFEKENPTHRFIRMNPFPANLVSICGVIFTGISYTYTVYVFRIICTLCSCVLVANIGNHLAGFRSLIHSLSSDYHVYTFKQIFTLYNKFTNSTKTNLLKPFFFFCIFQFQSKSTMPML